MRNDEMPATKDSMPVCHLCQKNFRTIWYLRKHLKNKHQLEPSDIEDVVPRKKFKYVQLQTHSKVNSDNSEKMSTIRTTRPTCSAVNCLSKYYHEGITFFPFPKDEDLKKKWVEAMNRVDIGSETKLWEPKRSSNLCSIHFRPNDIEKKSILGESTRKDAVPSIFPPAYDRFYPGSYAAQIADPLQLLRNFNITGRNIIERNGQIIFGDLSWPKNTPTNWLKLGSPESSRKSGRSARNSVECEMPKEYYTLETILFFSKNTSLSYYVKASAENIPVVYTADRADLISYLSGYLESPRAIDFSAPLEKPSVIKDYKSICQEIFNEAAEVKKVKGRLIAIVEKLSHNYPVVPKKSSEKPPFEDTQTFKVLEDKEKARERLAAELKANAPVTTSTREVKKVKGDLTALVDKLCKRKASQRLAAELKTNAPVTTSILVKGLKSTIASGSGPSSTVSCVNAAISIKKFECNPVVFFSEPANDTNINAESSDSENEVVTDPLENDISEMKINVEMHQEDDSPTLIKDTDPFNADLKILENENELPRAEIENVKLHVPAIDISDIKNEAIAGLDELHLINEIKQMRSDLKRMDQKVQTLTKNVDQLNSKLQASENENKLAKTEIEDLKRKICKLEDRPSLPTKKRRLST